MKKYLFLLIIPFLSFGQNFEERVLGSCRAEQFVLKQIDNNEFLLYMESYRRITKSGWSDRRYNYTTKTIKFKEADMTLNQLYNELDSMFENKVKHTLIIGKNKLEISPTDFSSIELSYKGVSNYLSKSDLNKLFKKVVN